MAGPGPPAGATFGFDPVAAFLRRPLEEVVGAHQPAAAPQALPPSHPRSVCTLHALARAHAWAAVLDLSTTLLAADDDNDHGNRHAVTKTSNHTDNTNSTSTNAPSNLSLKSSSPTFSDQQQQQETQTALKSSTSGSETASLPALSSTDLLLCAGYRALALLQTRQTDRAADALAQITATPNNEPEALPFGLRLLGLEVRIRRGDASAITDAYALRTSLLRQSSNFDSRPRGDINIEIDVDSSTEQTAGAIDCANDDDVGRGSQEHTSALERTSVEDVAEKRRWEAVDRERAAVLQSALASFHLRAGQSDAAADAAAELVRAARGAPPAWLAYARVLLAGGDVCGATAAVTAGEAAGGDTGAIGLHRGLVLAARCRFSEAVGEFDRAAAAVTAPTPEDRDTTAGAKDYIMAGSDDTGRGKVVSVAAANNAAICLVQLGRLAEAIDRLESALRRAPQTALDEGIVTNLATLYDLGYPDSASEKKRVLQRLASRFARQGFDVDKIGS